MGQPSLPGPGRALRLTQHGFGALRAWKTRNAFLRRTRAGLLSLVRCADFLRTEYFSRNKDQVGRAASAGAAAGAGGLASLVISATSRLTAQGMFFCRAFFK